jgi:hypothetical protein
MTQWSSMEQPGGVGALPWNGAAVSLSVGRLVVEGYPIPRGALDTSLHTRRLCKRGGGGGCHKRRRTQALGGMCFLRMWADTCFRISFGGMYTVRLG